MKKRKINDEKIIFNLLIFVIYSFTWVNLSTIFSYIGIDVKKLSENTLLMYSLIFEMFVVFMLIIINNNKLKIEFKDFKKNISKYFGENIIYWLAGLGGSIIINALIIDLFKTNISDNQAAINTLFKINPLYVIVSAVILAPITEELIFRRCFRNIFKADTAFVIISGLVFGLFHVINISTSWAGFAYAFSYAALGSAFAYMLVKRDNIFIPISFHMMHNGIMLLLQILLLIFTKQV